MNAWPALSVAVLTTTAAGRPCEWPAVPVNCSCNRNRMVPVPAIPFVGVVSSVALHSARKGVVHAPLCP